MDNDNDNINTNDRSGVCNFLDLCLLDDAYVHQLLDQLKKVNHASITSGVVRIPHAPYIHLQSCLFDTGSITNKNDGGNYIDPDHIDDNVIVKDVMMDAQFVFNAYEVYHFAYRKVLDDKCILVTNELKAEHNISVITQNSSSFFINRMYDQFCHFMEQS